MTRLCWIAHNCVAHPLMVLWPRLGAWLHGWTAERMGAPDV